MKPNFHINSLFNSVSYRYKNCLIDAGDEWNGFENVVVVLLTHAHFDHIYGLNNVLRMSPNALVYTNEYGRDMLLNAKKNMSYYHDTPFVFKRSDSIRIVQDSQEILIDDGLFVNAVFTPGHNPSCITWIIGDAIFTGDSLIPGVKTVTNLPGGNKTKAIESENLIKCLAIGKTIYTGHKVWV